MRVADFDKRLQPAYRELARALGRLEAPQGRVSRRNARAAVKAAQRKLTTLTDRFYPGQRKTAKTRKRRTPEQRERQLRRDDWLTVPNREGVLSRIAAEGIRVQRVKHPDGIHTTWAPAWAVAIAQDMPGKLGLAKRNLRERRALITEMALGHDDGVTSLVGRQMGTTGNTIVRSFAMNPKDKLATARLMAAQKMPYFRVAITSLVPKEAPGLGTFGVTKHGVMLWDPACLEKWSVEETAAVLVHEVSHLLRDHSDRCERISGEHKMWNVAADMEINDDIVAAGLKLPDDGVYPASFNMDEGLLAEEYYRELDKLPKITITVIVEGEGEGDGEGDSKGNGKGGVGRGKCGGCAGNPGEGEEEIDGKSGRSDVELERIKRAVAEAIHREAEAGSGRGTVPAGWQRWADQQLKPPKIPWRQKLARAVRGAIAYRPGAVDYHYTRPSRRQAGVGFGPGKPVLPALRAPIPKVAVVVDTSGSMGDEELLEAVSETRGVLDACGANVTFCACDAEVHELKQVRHWKDVVGLLKGGGGTSFIPAFEALEKQRPRCDVVIFVTDGCGPAPVEPPPFKVIWVLVGPYKQMPYAGDGPVTWGEVIELTEDGAEEAA